MAEKKHIAFALLRILQEETDEDHIMPVNELMDKLNHALDLDIERRTLYSNIDVLRQAGYEISDYKENRKGYYLITRQFEKGEVLLLCNAIHASHFINQKQSNDLIQKLLSSLSAGQQKEFKDSVYMPNDQKTDNSSLFLNIEVISEAIQNSKKISFTYLHYDKNKKLIPKRKEPYIVEPRYIVYNDARPYMISTNPKYTDFAHYRIDKMLDIRIIDQPVRFLSKTRETEAYQYARNKLFMFTGEMISVTFRCKERIMDPLVDIFGPSLKVTPAEEGYFVARVRTTENGALFLAQQFLDAIELIEPEDLKDELEKRILAILKR